MHPHNPHNPLLNRLFQTKSSKKKRASQTKQQPSMRDKILVPKLASKPPLQLGSISTSERQKTVLLKPNLAKLPPISEKQISGSTSKKTTFRQRKVSFRDTSHDQMLFPTQLNFSTPQLQQRKQQQQIKIQKEPPKKYKTVSSQPVIHQTQQQLFEYLKILEKNQQLKEQFCYMNRGDYPYSYYIVDYDQVNKKEFLTVSLRGVSIFKQGQNQFTTVDKLSREIQLYRKVKKIQFFERYLIQKTLKHWKYRTVRRKFQFQCRTIGKILLSQNILIQRYLQFLFNIAEDFIKCKFLDVRFSSTGSLQTLQKQLKDKQGHIEKSIQYLQNQIQKNLKQTIQKNLTKFRQEQRVSLTSDGKEGGEEGFLPYDTKKKSMKYTQMAKLKQFEASMYRLLKMTDSVRFTTKASMIKDGLQNFISQLNILHQKYLKRKQVSFVSWVNMRINIKKPHKNAPAVFECVPTVEQIQQTLQQYLKNILDKFYKKHFLLIQRTQDFHCETYEPNVQQFTIKADFKYYIEQNREYVELKNKCQQKILLCLSAIRQSLEKAESELLTTYNQSFMANDINTYMQNQPLKMYLISQAKSRQFLSKWEPIIQFGIIYLDMSQALVMVKQKFQQKFKFISNAIPFQVVKRCQSLAQQIKQIYNIFKQNPSTVQEFINFMKRYNQYKTKIQILQKKIDQILQLEDMVYKNGLRIGQASKIHINQCSTYYRQLQKRFEQIQANQQKQRKKFYKMIDDMVQPLDLKSQQLYNKIYEDNLISNSDSNTKKCLQKLEQYQSQFKKLKDKKEELFHYQNELKLGNKDLPNYFKLQSSLQWIIKIWKGRQKYQQFLNHINTRGYAEKSNLNILDLKQFLRDIQLATTQIQFAELLQNFKHDSIRVLGIIQICRLLSADTLQDEHKKKIKEKLVTQNKKIKDYLFLIQGGRTIICNELIKDTNIMEIKDELEQTVHASAQESIIKKNIQQIQQFWKKSKIIIVNADLAKNGSQTLHFGRHQNQRLQQKIGSYLMTFKNILGSKHSVGELHRRVMQQIATCQYFKKLIQKWIEVQREWIKLLPLMTNCPSVKHQSNVYFQFTSVDNSIRKHNRNINDLVNVKKIADDYMQKRYLNLMENCQRQLIEVNKIFTNFLQMKRNTYHRFFFLADQQLITILQNTKDGKSMARYAGYCFNCDRLLLDKQLISGFQTPKQVLKLRKGVLKGEPDEMFKNVQQNMKQSLKSSILTLIPKMKIGMNIEQQHQNCLQAVLVADRFLWTEMTQLYMNPAHYQSYQLYLRRSCEELAKFIKKTDLTPEYRYKISVRLAQAMGLRQIGEQMVKLQVTKQDFKWKQQRKYTLQQQQIVITQFNRKFLYGLEYYPPSKITIPTENYKMLLSQVNETSLGSKVLLVTGVEGDGKRNLIYACAQQYGCFYKELVCNKNISIQYIMRFVQGAILAGAWLSFYEFQHLQNRVLVKLLNEIKKVIVKLNQNQLQNNQSNLAVSGNIQYTPPGQTPILRIPNNANQFPFPRSLTSQRSIICTHNRVMFNFITHGLTAQKLSVYRFDSFVICQPSYKKICEWLLQVNNFTEWENLSMRLIAFLQTIFPLLQRVMGSFMSILRKVIDAACYKKKTYDYNFKQTDIFAETFKQQILQKSDENIHQILYQALHSYFYYEIPQQLKILDKKLKSRSPLRRNSISIDSKLLVLKNLIQKKVNHILVIGPRTNKSSLIRQACASMDKQILTIYPQASQYFFHDDAIQKLNKLGQKQIIHYDGQSIVREWNDLVISGYLLMEGKKIHLHNQLIIQLREVNNCSPSFVGSCQIVYVGNSFTKKDKFLQLSQAQSCQPIMQAMTQIFGDQLQNIPQHLIQVIAYFLKPYAKDPRSKNYHKLISWLGTVLGIQGLWNRYYGGRYNDVTVNKYTQQLVPIDQSKYLPVQQESYGSGHFGTLTTGNLLVHTKNTILYFQLYRYLKQISIPVLFCAKYNSGKSTIIKLILSNIKSLNSIENNKKQKQITTQQKNQYQNKNEDQLNQQNEQITSQTLSINLPVKLKTSAWTKLLKSSLTNIRKDGKNFLVNVGDKDIIVAVDDLDLGFEYHREYLRQIIDLKMLHDSRFEQNMIEKAKIVVAWHKQNSQQNLKQTSKRSLGSTQSTFKLFDRMAQLQIPQFNKQSLSTIIRTNIQHFTKKNNMSKEVVNIIDTHLIKCLLIAFDDITNISGLNYAASIVMAVMRNLLSMPKRNVLMNVQNYVNYFKIQLKTRMMEKCFTTKSLWQYNNVYQNLNKVVLNTLTQRTQIPIINSSQNVQSDQKQNQVVDQTVLVYQQKQYKTQPLSKIKQKILQSFPHLYLFDEMLKLIIKLNNQLQTIDHNCILIGRSGTGKQTILQIVASLNKTSIYVNKYDLSECILKCLRGESVILLQSYLRRDFRRFVTSQTGTLYQKIQDCLSDQQLYKMLTDDKLRKQYNQLTNLIPNNNNADNSCKALNKVKQKLKNIIVFDTVVKYKQATNRFRQLNRYFVCYIDEWPAQALLNISGINITQTQISQQTGKQVDNNKRLNNVDLPKLLAEVYATTNRIMQDYDESAISINKFKNFLKIYEYMYEIRNKQLTQKVQFYTKIYSKFNDACNLIAQWERRVDILRIQLEESAKKLDQQLKQNKLQSFIFAILYSRKAAEQETVVTQNQKMAQIKKKLQKQLVGLKKMMDNIQKLVGSIQRTEMSELKKIYKSSELVSFGLQVLCLLLGEEPLQKSINKILADPNLMMKMKSSALLQNKNTKVIQKFKKQFDGVKQQYQSKTKNQVSRILIDWVKSVIDYWHVLTDFQALSSEHKKHKADYEQSLSRQKQIQQSIKGLSQTAIKLNKNCQELFRKKQQNMEQYGKINIKLKNARILLPALKKSEQQTWEMIKQLRNNLSGLLGNMVLSTVCLVYLPLKRLRLKKHVLDEIKKLLNSKMIEFSLDFMSLISRSQDAVLEDLNLTAIKQLEDFPVLIIDPQRRAMSYLFEQDAHLAATVISKNLADISKSQDVAVEIGKHIKKQKQMKQENISLSQKSQKSALQLEIPLQQSQALSPQDINVGQQLRESSIIKYTRKNPILHTTDQNFKILLQKLPQNTFIIDWKFTTIDTSQKIFFKIATNKKPEYFEAKKFLNKKIKKDILKIEQYKSQIYHTICDKQIKILQDSQFIEIGTKLVNLQIETEQNKLKQKQKIQQIKQYAKQINQQVNKVLCIVNSLKKIKNIALDLILDIACSSGNTIQNIIKWVLCTLPPNKRLGWMLSIALEFVFQSNQQLLSILIKDTPLKISQIARHKKPVNISTKNYENLCKLSGYSTNLKNFCEGALRNAKQFQVWTLDNIADSIPSMFKPQILTITEQLTVIKIMKPKILISTIKKHIKTILNLQSLQGYTNRQLIRKTSKKYPIIAYCTMEHLQKLCSQLNNSKICVKNLVQITDSLQMKRFLWSQMSQGNWVVLHSVYDINSRETLQDIIEYVSNYQQQQQFRIFLFADQVQLSGYDTYYSEVTTKYNNISRQASNNKRSILTQQAQLISQSKYLENIGVNIYEQAESFRRIFEQTIQILGVQLPAINAQIVQQNPSIAAFFIPQTPKLVGSQNKPGTPLNPSLLLSNILNTVGSMNPNQKQKIYVEKLAIFTSICQVAVWNKFSKLKYNKLNQKVYSLLRYIKEYSIPLQFNLYAVASYLGRLYSGPLQAPQRTDVQELTERIIDQTKLNERVLFGIPIQKHSIAMVLAGIGRAGVQLDKNWIDDKILNNYQLLGCQQSYISSKNADIMQHVFQTLGDIRFANRSIKQQAIQIRTALARLPTNLIVFSREVKNVLFLHCYMIQMKIHNKDIVSARQFMDWVNISSNQDFKQDEIVTARSSVAESTNSADFAALQAFTWPNLLHKIKQLTGLDVSPHKVRAVLSAWLQNIKRRHQFLLYWNLDNPVLVLHPVLLSNFSMIVSSYVINYLSANYQKFKLQAQSTNQNILYTLQIQFSRQTDQKQLYMTQGILLPDLLYKQFKYNFEYKMLDGVIDWNGQEEAPLIMLKMKKIPSNLDPITGKQKQKEDYEPPQIEIGTRVLNNIEVVYKIKTYIDGNYQEWGLRRPMLISQ